MVRKTEKPGEIGGYWLSQRANSPMWRRTWFDAKSRQTRRESLGTEDFEQAKLILADWVLTNAEVRDQKPEDVLLEVVLTRHYQQHAVHLRSEDQYRHACLKWIKFFEGAMVSEVTPKRQREFVAWMREAGNSDGYIRRNLACGKAALNWAQREGEILSVPFINLALAPESEPRERILSIEEVAALFNAADWPHMFAYLMVAFGTAARPEAILQLTTDQIDLDRRLIHLNPPGRTQTKKRRPVLPVVEYLMPFFENIPNGPAVSYYSRPVKSIITGFRRLRERAGVGKDVIPYTIRHTMASEMRRRGVPNWEVAGWLGHTSGYKTTERYAKFSSDHLGGAAQAVDDYFLDLEIELGFDLSDHDFWPQVTRQRVTCVSPWTLKVVEPGGIEPPTSTMPL